MGVMKPVMAPMLKPLTLKPLTLEPLTQTPRHSLVMRMRTPLSRGRLFLELPCPPLLWLCLLSLSRSILVFGRVGFHNSHVRNPPRKRGLPTYMHQTPNC